MSSMQRRVVITGVGMVSPLGNSKEDVWASLVAGKSGIAPQTVLPPDSLPITFGAQANEFTGKIDNFGPLDKARKKAIRKGLKVMCRECQMGVAASQLALLDANGPEAGDGGSVTIDPSRTGIVFGADYMVTIPDEFTEAVLQCVGDDGKFDFSRWAPEGLPRMSPLWLLKYLPNMPASHLAIYNDLRGPNNSLTLREAAANAAVAEAYQVILRDRADRMLVGATGTRLHPMKMLHASQQEELADPSLDPTKACRPFDRDRTGIVLGEGAGAVILEELSLAEARGATIYGEIVAGATSSAIGRDTMAPRRQKAMANVLRAVLSSAGIAPGDVGHIHAHGLSTQSCDVEEAAAISEIFGSPGTCPPVVAAKSYFGNLGAGSGMVEIVTSLLALQSDKLFPILNYETPDPACPIAAVTELQDGASDGFVTLSVTPQAQASALIVRRFG